MAREVPEEKGNFYLETASISGFWGSRSVEAEFFEDCSIFIGPNGSGKTTFIEILRACLAVDLNQLARLDFMSCQIRLRSQDGAVRTVQVERGQSESRLLDFTYKISKRVFPLRTFAVSDRDRYPYSVTKRHDLAVERVRQQISSLVGLSSISVNRANLEADLGRRSEPGFGEWGNAVDFALNQIIKRLLQYRMRLFDTQAQIQRSLREEVLLSLIEPEEGEQELNFSFFESEKERKRLSENLRRTFLRLGVSRKDLNKKVGSYVDDITQRVEKTKRFFEKVQDEFEDPNSVQHLLADLMGERYQIIQSVTSRTLESDGQIEKLYEPIRQFEEIVNRFFDQKKISLSPSGFSVLGQPENREIALEHLSSGEKQLLILLTEVFLQRRQKFVFITDEPELSLHIEWQGELLDSIRTLNPNAQIIIATHSPEIASSSPKRIVQMSRIVR